MLLIPKSMSKDIKTGMEQKTLSKSAIVFGGSNGLPSNAYNPLLGTFHAIDTSSTSPTKISLGNGGDCDSASTNDSRSVESEDQNKEKSNASNKLEVVPGADNDKREKVRQMNEKKHQRQKEKRALELHERCSGYLMSRKLETLAQQLVSMGFSHARSTVALVLNEGRVEDAVAWLFEGGDKSDKHKDQILGNNLKIDVSEEISRIAEMEIKFKRPKQEVEKVIISCEGDLEKSEEVLRTQKHDQAAAQPKPAETGDSKLNSVSSLPLSRDNEDLIYVKGPATWGLAVKSTTDVFQPVTRVQSKLEWARPQPIAKPLENSLPVGGGSIPSVSYSLAPPLKVDARYAAVGYEFKNLESVREPIVMLQRPQSVNTKFPPATSICSSSPEVMQSNGFFPDVPSNRNPSLNSLTSHMFYQPTQHQQQFQSFNPRSSPMDNSTSNRVTDSFPRRGASPTHTFMPDSSPWNNQVSNRSDSFSRMASSQIQTFTPGSCQMDNSTSSRVNDPFLRLDSSSTQINFPGSSTMNNAMSSQVNDSFPRKGTSVTHGYRLGSSQMGNLVSNQFNDSFPIMGASPTLAAASSLGLFSRHGSPCSSGSTSTVDWNASSSMPSCDYNSIDWSLDKTFLTSKPNGLWTGLGSYSRSNDHVHDSGASTMSVNWSFTPSSSNKKHVRMMGLQDGVSTAFDPMAATSQELTSTFEGKDLFSLPRQSVFFPMM